MNTFQKPKYNIFIAGLSLVEAQTLEDVIRSYGYIISDDFILCLIGDKRFRYINDTNPINFALLIYNEEIIKDPRMKRILLEYVI